MIATTETVGGYFNQVSCSFGIYAVILNRHGP